MNNIFIKADYSGQELRVLAEVSKDANMVDAFNKNYDLHLFTANRIFNLGLSELAFVNDTEAHSMATEKFKRKRHQAKNGVNFPVIYGAFPKRIAEDNEVSIIEAQRWLDEFYNLYPGVAEAIKATKKELRTKGYVQTLFGRKRRFPEYKSAGRFDKGAMERQAFNMKIQGTSADIGKIAGIQLSKILPDYRALLCLFVHDEYVIECPEDKAEELMLIVKDTMEHCVALSVPLVVDCKIVSNFGE